MSSISTPPGYLPTRPQDLANKTYVDARTPKITSGTTAPSSPAIGDAWIDMN